MNITKGKQKKSQRIVLYGPEGIGKSTLASKFPNPVFIDTEGGTDHLDVHRIEKASSWVHFKAQLKEFNTNQSGYGTLVIDTVDWLEIMCSEYVCQTHNQQSIEGFGYGKGYTYLAEEWGRFLNCLTDIQSKAVHVILVGHAHMRKFEQPDEAGAYDRWELKLSKKCAPITKEWADMVLFLNYKTFVVDVDGKKKVQGGERVMYTTHNPCWDAKNRSDLKQELPLNFESIAHCFGNVPAKKNKVSANAPEPTPEPTPEPKAPVPEPLSKEDLTAFPAKLWDLMTMHGVTEEEIQTAVASKGYYPIDTPIAVYDQKFVDGVLVGAWDKVYAIIQTQRKG